MRIKSNNIYKYLFFASLALQVVFWLYTKDTKPEYDLIPKPIDPKYAKLISMGDDEFLFRSLVLRVQNSGDIYAGFVPLRKYDYQKLFDWFMFLENLNDQSNQIPTLAAYTYSNIDDEKKIRHLIDYLQYRGEKNIDKNWWWVFQSIYLARKIDDKAKALELAKLLSQNKDPKAPLWTKQVEAFIHAKYGDGCLAFFAIQNVIKDLERKNIEISVDDMNFIRYFINVRLKRLKNNNFNPNNCKK